MHATGMTRPARASRAEREVVRTDRRWFLAALGVFAVSVASLLGAYGIYKATGPHPEMTLFLRRVKRIARRLVPQWRKLKADR